ncbi:MAG: hypothetical protein KIT25_12330 [Enhydrobacter sp.]|nr:MAG: hypothetical protein KIT25_12330 [Enhydrobacter sp.]
MAARKVPVSKGPQPSRITPFEAAVRLASDQNMDTQLAVELLEEFMMAGAVALLSRVAPGQPGGHGGEPYKPVPKDTVLTRRFDIRNGEFPPEAPTPVAILDLPENMGGRQVVYGWSPKHQYAVDYPDVRRALKQWQDEAPKDPGGAPPKWHWDRAHRWLLERIFGPEQWHPTSQEEIATAYAWWFQKFQRNEPEPSDRRARAAELYRALNAFANRPKADSKNLPE